MSEKRFIVAETKSGYNQKQSEMNTSQIVFVKDTKEIITQGITFDGSKLTESDITAMGFTKNTGDITEVRVNGTTIATSGVADISIPSIPQSVNDLSDGSDLVRKDELDTINQNISDLITADNEINETLSQHTTLIDLLQNNNNFEETDPIFNSSAAANITSNDIINWNNKTSNTGTITGIKMNGTTVGTSGIVDLGTVITELPYATETEIDALFS